MLYFWLIAGAVITIGITYMVITEGFRKWRFYYVFAVLCFIMYFMRKWMMKRMDNHLEFLESQKKEEE